ncbi:MAG: CoA activase, partial [Deltaproteobacteria bacterium]|nr:CoA activase [Deltaproteobacteria bacterium]
MIDSPTILGIDVGAVSVALCELSLDGEPLKTACYEAHQGDVRGVLARMLAEVALPRVGWLACTGAAASHVTGGRAVDPHLAHVAAVRHVEPDVGTILVLGGERFSIIRFDGQGAYRGSQTNSSCAAGTGSFLDQYARTLGFGDSAELAQAALRAGDVAPPIASRCAVFAKTDLIHAQQQGYSREAICNGLCDGLAAIVADTVLSGPPVTDPIVLSGGVALNQAVRAHLARRLARTVQAEPESHLHAALGAALVVRSELDDHEAPPATPGRWSRPEELLADHRPTTTTCHAPLGTPSAGYPDFDDHPSYLFEPRLRREAPAVEVDVYVPAVAVKRPGGHLGIDVGSTSTKAVLIDDQRQVLVGLYTRTTGRPIVAVQALLEALEDWLSAAPAPFRIAAAATTGAGRKLIGAVVGANLVVNEISAHARAATELRPEVDTIIELGGQDAKFTTLRRGTVTSAFMNTVCAAGTGSFIEEQARQLGCSLADYGDTVAAARSPYASDRCTVFMQRDISHLLGAGHDVPEVLASVLHSVRDNYLQRVAREASIGTQVCFQGATAKNPALVAAFEQRLGRPIAVSRYCHLTGALGAALLLAEQAASEPGSFRGLGLARDTIGTANERCDLCRNRCIITTATIGGEQVAYGFRCGRDLDTKRYVSANRSGFALAKARRAVERRLGGPAAATALAQTPTVGIPAALQLYDQLPFWKRFFTELGVPLVTSEGLEAPVSQGKRIAKAEFCAPMTAFHAHVTSLADRADFVFTPVLLEGPRPDRRSRRQYCFYSQYASSLIESLGDPRLVRRTLRPLLKDQRNPFPSVSSLTTALRPVLGETLSRVRVAQAFRAAHRHATELREQLQALMDRERVDDGQLA